MALHSLTIPQTSLPVGQSIFGPVSIGNNNDILLTIDRTVPGGLNSLSGTSTLAVDIESSADGGTTWRGEAGCVWVGGIFVDHHGQVNSVTLQVFGVDPGKNSCRVRAQVGGPVPIVVAGSINVT